MYVMYCCCHRGGQAAAARPGPEAPRLAAAWYFLFILYILYILDAFGYLLVCYWYIFGTFFSICFGIFFGIFLDIALVVPHHHRLQAWTAPDRQSAASGVATVPPPWHRGQRRHIVHAHIQQPQNGYFHTST